jgi:hypothetical protein
VNAFDLGPSSYHECLTFGWLAMGAHGESTAAYVIDGRDYADEDRARSAVREALARTDQRAPVAEFWPRGIAPESGSELAYLVLPAPRQTGDLRGLRAGGA